MRAIPSIGLLLVFVILALLTGCSSSKTELRREFSLGTNGNVLATFDKQQRVRELKQLYSNQSLKLKVSLSYSQRDLKCLLVFDPKGRKVWETVFDSDGVSGTGRNSDVPSPGWEVRMENNWSGRSGDVHDRRCGVSSSFPERNSFVSRHDE